MSYYYRQVQFGPGSPTPVVKNLIIANVAVFLVQSILTFTDYSNWVVFHFGMTPALFLRSLHIWQPFTYMFLHGGLFHVGLNMIFLWMFGTEVEQRMGSRQFSIYYFACGIGAGIITYFFSIPFSLFGDGHMAMIPTVGASGALFGVMLAFGLFFPNRIVLLFLILPVKAFYLVIGLGLLNLYSLVFVQGGVSYIAHLGGMLCGYLFLRYYGDIAGAYLDYSDRKEETRRENDRRKNEEEQKKVDEILDTINRDGMHTLSRAERKFLRDRSRRRKG